MNSIKINNIFSSVIKVLSIQEYHNNCVCIMFEVNFNW